MQAADPSERADIDDRIAAVDLVIDRFEFFSGKLLSEFTHPIFSPRVGSYKVRELNDLNLVASENKPLKQEIDALRLQFTKKKFESEVCLQATRALVSDRIILIFLVTFIFYFSPS